MTNVIINNVSPCVYSEWQSVSTVTGSRLINFLLLPTFVCICSYYLSSEVCIWLLCFTLKQTRGQQGNRVRHLNVRIQYYFSRNISRLTECKHTGWQKVSLKNVHLNQIDIWRVKCKSDTYSHLSSLGPAASNTVILQQINLFIASCSFLL